MATTLKLTAVNAVLSVSFCGVIMKERGGLGESRGAFLADNKRWGSGGWGPKRKNTWADVVAQGVGGLRLAEWLMIVALGMADDQCVIETLGCLRERGEAAAFLQQDQLRLALQLSWHLPAGAGQDYLVLEGRRVGLRELQGVLVRLQHPFPTIKVHASDDEAYMETELSATVYGLLRALACPVINRPRPGVYARHLGNRWHAKEVISSGLALPETLVTDDAKEAAAFLGRQGRTLLAAGTGGVLLEGAAGERSLRESEATSFNVIAVGSGRWRRVFVAGTEVFAAEVDSPVAAGEWVQSELPARLGTRCKDLAARLDLQFAEVLVQSGEDGREVAVGLSDMPDLARCSAALGQAVARALATALAHGRDAT